MLPICRSCAKSKYLCRTCQQKYDLSQITPLEVEASKILYGLFGDDMCLRHAVETSDGVVVVVAAGDVGKVIGEGGRSLRTLSEALGKSVRVIGDGDFADVAKALIAPARVKSITQVHSGGAEKLRVHVNENDLRLLRMNPVDLGKLVASVTDKAVELLFD